MGLIVGICGPDGGNREGRLGFVPKTNGGGSDALGLATIEAFFGGNGGNLDDRGSPVESFRARILASFSASSLVTPS